MKMKLSQIDKKTLMSTILFGLLSLLMLIIVWLGVSNTLELRDKIILEEDRIIQQTQQLNILRILKSKDAEMQIIQAELQAKLPNSASQNNLFQAMNILSNQLQVAVTSVTFAASELAAPLVNQLPFSMQLSGSYTNIMVMLEELLNGGQLSSLRSISLVGGTGDQMTATAQAVAYYR